MTIKLANNVSGFLNTTITASDTGIVLQSGNGASFPALGAGEYFYATLVSTGGTLEVVKVTARSGDSMTVVRAQDGTSAASFAAGSRVEMRINAQAVLDVVDQVTASQVGFTPVGGIAATDVQAAIAEVGTDLAASGGSALVGFLQAGTGAQARTVQAKLRETVSVKDFGAVGDGVTDDTAAIQAALDALQTYSAASSGATFYGNSQTLVFPFGRYCISQTLTYTKEYLTIESDGATFLPFAGFDQNTFVFDLTLWQAEVNDLVFSGFDNCIYAHNPNTDQGKVEFNNITIHGGQAGFKIDMRSTHTELNNCKWDRTVHPIEIIEGDRVDVNGGWCKQGVMTVDYDGSFLNSSTFAVLTLNDLLMVPILSTGSKTAWVKNYGQFRAYNARFGGESGARAWVNNFAQADTSAPIDPRGIIFDGCELYGTIEGVRCFYLPNAIIIRDCIGFADTDAFIHFDPTFETLDNELTRVGSNFSYVLDNPQRFKTLPVNDAKLLPYLYTGDGTSFGQTNTSTAAPATLLFQNGRDIQQILDTAEYSTFKVQLYTVRDTNVDTYSEFTVKGGGNLSPGVERVLVTSLHTGADATAPVLFLDTDDLVKIQLNGDTDTRLVFYRITKVGRFFG